MPGMAYFLRKRPTDSLYTVFLELTLTSSIVTEFSEHLDLGQNLIVAFEIEHARGVPNKMRLRYG